MSPSPRTRPLIGVTLDAEPPGGYSRYPWYALRANYAEAVAACGGLPVALPHAAALSAAYLDRLDALHVAVLSDCLDQVGVRDNVLLPHVRPLTENSRVSGYAATVSLVEVDSVPDDVPFTVRCRSSALP